MKLEEVSELKQTTEIDKVNELLKKGYKLIKILSTRTHNGDYDVVMPTYILGRTE